MINLPEQKTSSDLYADWEDKAAEAYEQIDTPMEMRKFEIEPKAEKALRRAIVEKALESLQTEIQEQTLFPRQAKDIMQC